MFNPTNNDAKACSCYGCTERKVGCHSTCAKYKDFVEMLKKRNQVLKDEAKNYAYIKENHERIVKLKRRSY